MTVTATATFADQMVAKYQQLLLENAGAASVDVDGRKVAYADLEAKWRFWKAQAAKEKGRRPVISRIRLDRF